MSTSTDDRRPMRLGRYRTTAGERWLIGHRVAGVPRIIDHPAPGTPGAALLVEDGLTSKREVLGIVRDYLEQARATGAPAVHASAERIAESIAVLTESRLG